MIGSRPIHPVSNGYSILHVSKNIRSFIGSYSKTGSPQEAYLKEKICNLIHMPVSSVFYKKRKD
jgi:hypothetical protein